MKKFIALLFVVFAAAACTPDQLRAYNAVNGTDYPEPPIISATDRDAALSLPATFVTETVHGQTVNVVAWVGADGEDRGHFVYETNGSRWLVQLNSEPLHAYVWPVSADGCVADPFGQIAYDPEVCGRIPVSTPIPS